MVGKSMIIQNLLKTNGGRNSKSHNKIYQKSDRNDKKIQ